MAKPASAIFYQSGFWRSLRAECFRRDGGKCVVPGCTARATRCDHINRRPYSVTPTRFDVLENLRSLCATHDAQVKETAGGDRRGGGAFKVIGCDASGWPIDPRRH